MTPTYVDSCFGVVRCLGRWRLMALLRRGSCFRGRSTRLWVSHWGSALSLELFSSANGLKP